jgi:hypothetical protein
VWKGPFFTGVARLSSGAVALDTAACAIVPIDLATGRQRATPVSIPTVRPWECHAALLGDALLLQGPQEDALVDPLTRRPRLRLVRPLPEVQFAWFVSGSVGVAVEHYTARMRPLPPSMVHAFDLATGESRWKTAVPVDAITVGGTTDAERVYVALKPASGLGPARILALRLADGARLWETDGDRATPAHHGGPGLLTWRGGAIVSLDAATGAEQWRWPLAQRPIIGMILGEVAAHFEVGDIARVELVTLARADGRELWRTALRMPSYDAVSLTLAGGRVFHHSFLSDAAGLLSGFDAISGEPTLVAALPGHATVFRVPGEQDLLIAASWPLGTMAFGPVTGAASRALVASGVISHAPRSKGAMLPFSSMQVCAAGVCATPDANGHYRLEIHAQGAITVELRLDTFVWEANTRLPRSPPMTEYCARVDPLLLDAITARDVTWSPAVDLKICASE